MSSLSIGLSGVLVHQRLIDLTGQNITNANTPGYHRQVGELATRISGGSTATGIELKSITRVIDSMLEDASLRNTSTLNGASTQLDGLLQMQAYLAPGQGSLTDSLAAFFDSAIQLSVNPGDRTQRRTFLAAAQNVADQLNAATHHFSQMQANLLQDAHATIAEANSLSSQVAQLNREIKASVLAGLSPNALLDQRDAAIAQLAGMMDLRTIPQDFGEVNLLVAGVPLVLNSDAIPLRAETQGPTGISIHSGTAQHPLAISGGSLGGILHLTNAALPHVQQQMNTLAKTLIASLDHLHATGAGLTGPMTVLSSQRPVEMPNLPLAVSDLAFPPGAGDLYITITDLATGERSMHRVAIDPASQSLTGVAAAIDAVPNLQAVVDAGTGTLTLLAEPGFGFDFTGNFSTGPDAQSITGTTQPTFDGRYSGPGNDTLDFRFVGTGTIGVTPGLTLEVRNGAGVLVGALNVGQGYEAGTKLAAVLGVNVRLTTGTVNDGDSFGLRVADDADSGRLLPALGLHSFFVGDDAGSLRVNPDLVADPARLALGFSGQGGDGANLARIIALRERAIVGAQEQTFQQYLESVLGDVGNQTNDAQTRKAAVESLGAQLDLQRQAASGVDPNEELAKLVLYQRSYQVSAHFISVVNRSLDELILLLGK